MSQTAAPSKTQLTTCPSCGSEEPWGFCSWCPVCGYYPALKMSVPVDNTTAPTEEEVTPASLLKSIPKWSLKLAAGMLAIIALSVWARLAGPAQGLSLLWWSVSQISAGAIVWFIGHGSAYLHAASLSDRFGPFDAFMKPIEIWQPTFAQLPQGHWRICLSSWGATAILTALFVVNGIPFASLLDAGKSKKKGLNIVHAVVDQAKKKRGAADGDLEGAMGAFAGEATDGVTDEDVGGELDKDGKKKSKEDEKEGAGKDGETDDEKDGEKDGAKDEAEDEAKDEKKDEKKTDAAKLPPGVESTDCLIFGYTPDGDRSFGLLLLATTIRPTPSSREQLKFVCTVTAESLTTQQRTELMKRMKKLQTEKPLVKVSFAGIWLRPVLMCRVRHQGWTRDKRLKLAEFAEMLPDIDAKPKPATPSTPRPQHAANRR